MNTSGIFEFDDLHLQLVDALLLLNRHAQVAETVEQFAGLFYAFDAQVAGEELDVVLGWVLVVDEDGLGQIVQGDIRMLLLDLSGPLRDL